MFKGHNNYLESMTDNNNQTALITGASGGIGEEFARQLGAKGYNLILVARSNDKLKLLKKAWEEEFNIDVHVFPTDLANKKQLSALYDKIKFERLRVDILINNAGFGDFGEFITTNWKKEDAMIRVNINALTFLSKMFAKEMVQNGHGYILNVASTAAFQPGPLMAVYYATKSYVLSYTQAIANELKGTGVKASVLCPGPTESDFVKNASLESSKLFKQMKPASSRDVAAFGLKAMFKGKVVAIPGFANRFLAFSGRFLPRKLTTQLVRKMQDRA